MNKKSFFSLMGGIATLSLCISAMAEAPSFTLYLNNNTSDTLNLQISTNLNPSHGTSGTFTPVESPTVETMKTKALGIGDAESIGSTFLGAGSVAFYQGETSCEVAYKIQYTQVNGHYVVNKNSNSSYYTIVGGILQCECVETPDIDGNCPVSSDGNFYVKWG